MINKDQMIDRKVTLYFRGEMFGNYHKIEARSYFVGTTSYAQYPPWGARAVADFRKHNPMVASSECDCCGFEVRAGGCS